MGLHARGRCHSGLHGLPILQSQKHRIEGSQPRATILCCQGKEGISCFSMQQWLCEGLYSCSGSLTSHTVHHELKFELNLQALKDMDSQTLKKVLGQVSCAHKQAEVQLALPIQSNV